MEVNSKNQHLKNTKSVPYASNNEQGLQIIQEHNGNENSLELK